MDYPLTPLPLLQLPSQCPSLHIYVSTSYPWICTVDPLATALISYAYPWNSNGPLLCTPLAISQDVPLHTLLYLMYN